LIEKLTRVKHVSEPSTGRSYLIPSTGDNRSKRRVVWEIPLCRRER
jgi:hypothetical protein